MNVLKKILIILVILIFTYIVCRLLMDRIDIQKKIARENFTIFGSKSENELSYLKNSDSVSIQNCAILDLPLREYCIKSSYNTALTGNYMNIDMIPYVLSRGCRFLDFEVFYIGHTTIDSQKLSTLKYTPEVAYSIDNTFTTISTENSLLLDNVLTSVITNAFSSPSINTNDPIFINLRIKSNNKDVYKAVAASIDNTIKDKLYTKKTETDGLNAIQVTRDTKLHEIMGKIILCFDKTTVRNYKDYTSCLGNREKSICYNLTKYINIETGGEDLNLLRYSDVMDQCVVPINIKDDNKTTDIKTMKYVIPNTKHDNAFNPVLSDFILKYSAQIPAYRFYKNDRQLRNYEEFFNDHGSAFVPLAKAIPYFKKLKD